MNSTLVGSEERIVGGDGWAESVDGSGSAPWNPDLRHKKSCIKSLSKITFAEQTVQKRI